MKSEENEDTDTNSVMNRKLPSLNDSTENSEIREQRNENEKFQNKFSIINEVPILYVRTIPYLSLSIINYMTISLCLFLFGLITLNFIKFPQKEQIFLQVIFLIGGLVEYVIGLYDWYRGNSFQCFVEFLLGLIFLNYFHYPLIKEFIGPVKDISSGEIIPPNEEFINCGWERIEGSFYLLVLIMAICILVSAKKKAFIHSLNYLSLCIGFIFIFVYKYQREKEHWTKKVYGYAGLIGGGLYWITGVLGFIQENCKRKNLNII